MKSINEYYDGMDLMPIGTIKISPSSIGKFFSQTSQWYRETLLGEDGFQGSTASILGTIVHHAAETLTVPTETQVYDYLNLQNCEYETADILTNYIPMCEAIIDEIQNSTDVIHSQEVFIHTHLNDVVHVGGTYDAIYTTNEIVDENGEVHSGSFKVLRDYKTASQKPSYGFTKEYSMQLLTYVYILKKQGITTDAIELKYITRPTKTLPARIFTFIKLVKPEDIEFIASVLNLISDSIIAFVDKPSTRHLLSQDKRLENCKCSYKLLEEEEI